MKENLFIRITPENSVQGIKKDGKETMLDFLYSAIGCKSIEIVRFGKRTKQVAVVDEEGKLNDSKLNLIASVLLHQHIYGVVIFCIEGECDLRGYKPFECACARYAIDRTLQESGLFSSGNDDE